MAFDTSGHLTLADIAALDKGAPYDVINETVASAKELQLFPAETIKGTTVELSVLQTLPTVGFSQVNTGVSGTKPQWKTKEFQSKPLTARIQQDRRAIEGSENPGRILANTTAPFMTALLSQACKCFWYGNKLDALAPPGIYDQYAADSTHQIDFGGSTQTTSAWMLSVDPESMKFLFGNSQTVVMAEQWKDETIYDANDLPIPGLINWINGRVGWKLANKNTAVRIKNISLEATNGVFKNKVTDAAFYAAQTLFENLGRTPNLIIARPAVFESLRQSRITSLVPNPPRITAWEDIQVERTINLATDETPLATNAAPTFPTL